jgi:hypothetical protein
MKKLKIDKEDFSYFFILLIGYLLVSVIEGSFYLNEWDNQKNASAVITGIKFFSVIFIVRMVFNKFVKNK